MMRVIRSIAAVLMLPVFTLKGGEADARDKGIAAFQQGRYSEALASLQKAAEAGQDDTASVFLALSEAALGDCRTALPALTVKRPGLDDRAKKLTWLAAVKCESVVGDDVSAFGMLKELEDKYPGDADVWYLAAKLHMKAFNDASFAMFQHTPASYRVHELSAEIFETQNRYADAASEYRKAIEGNAGAPELHYRLGRALLLEAHDSKALQEAAAQFKEELKLSPEDAACEYQLGQIAQAQGNSSDARAHFEQALSLSPGFAQAMVALGKLYAKDKQYDHAIKLLTKATDLQPDNEAAHYALLTAYRNSGDMQAAAREKNTLDRLQKPPEGEFNEFLKKLGEKQPEP